MVQTIMALVGFFVFANLATGWLNRRALSVAHEPMSSYLVGVPWAWLQDLGFVALAIALPLLGSLVVDPWGPLGFRIGPVAALVAAWTLDVSAVAVLVVVGTAYVYGRTQDQAVYARAKLLHKAAAGVAFAGTAGAVGVIGWHLWWPLVVLVALAPVSAILFAILAPSLTAVQEKTYAGFTMSGLYGVLIDLL